MKNPAPQFLLTPLMVFSIFLFLLPGRPLAADIVFAARPMGPSSNIYSINGDGHLKKLTDDSRWRDVMAHVGPDGAIVFASDRHENPGIDLYKKSVSLDLFTLHNGNITRLTDDADLEAFPQFSPHGKQIALIKQSDNVSKLQVMARNGRNARTTTSAQRILGFSWSPDGKSLAYAMHDGGRSAVEVVKLGAEDKAPLSLAEYRTRPSAENAGSTGKPELKGHAQVVTSAQWSPDGRKIAYVVSSLEQQERVLRVIDLESGEDLRISATDHQVQQPVTWAADSERLLYAALVGYNFHYDEKQHKKIYDGGMHIFLSDLNGQDRQLTEGDHLHNRPVFSPDGKHIAYLYGDKLDSRSLAIRIMTVNGKTVREMYSGVTGDSFLYWVSPEQQKVAELID